MCSTAASSQFELIQQCWLIVYHILTQHGVDILCLSVRLCYRCCQRSFLVSVLLLLVSSSCIGAIVTGRSHAW